MDERGCLWNLGRFGLFFFRTEEADIRGWSIWLLRDKRGRLEFDTFMSTDGSYWKGKQTDGVEKFFWFSFNRSLGDAFKFHLYLGHYALCLAHTKEET